MEWFAGDILAFWGGDWLSRAISVGTASWIAPSGSRRAPSHVGMIFEYRGEKLLAESTSFPAGVCKLRGVVARGMQAHDPWERVQHYRQRGGRATLFRLVDIDRLDLHEWERLTEICTDMIFEGVSYDTAGAALSGTRVLQLTRLFPYADLERLFCSEFVAAVLMRLNRMNRDNPSRFNPGRLIRELLRTGTYRVDTTWEAEF